MLEIKCEQLSSIRIVKSNNWVGFNKTLKIPKISAFLFIDKLIQNRKNCYEKRNSDTYIPFSNQRMRINAPLDWRRSKKLARFKMEMKNIHSTKKVNPNWSLEEWYCVMENSLYRYRQTKRDCLGFYGNPERRWAEINSIVINVENDISGFAKTVTFQSHQYKCI